MTRAQRIPKNSALPTPPHANGVASSEFNLQRSQLGVPRFSQKAIIHAHTSASYDSSLTPDAVIARCLDHGVDVLAVTDHNEISGALRLQRSAPFRVIVGEEIRTAARGEIIGLFLRERVPPDLSPNDTIAAIRAQGGLVYFPHPYDTTRGTAWPPGIVEPLLPEADIIETFNARNVTDAADALAAAAADRLQKVGCAGADAHTAAEYGRTLAFLPPFSSPAEFLRAVRAARFRAVRAPWWVGLRKRARQCLR